MTKNTILRAATQKDINERVERILRGLGNPEPPLKIETVRELLKLDRSFYTADDPGILAETFSRLKVGTKQFFKRPGLLIDAVRKADLRAFYIPDQKRILLDGSVPELKHRWIEAHEVGHSLLPWHGETALGDNKFTLKPNCHDEIEAEANYAAGQLLFLRDHFINEALAVEPTLANIRKLKTKFGNTLTTTLWRTVETWGHDRAIVGMISSHPHPARQGADFDPFAPCDYVIQSPLFAKRFSKVTEHKLFNVIEGYCTARKGGPLGEDEALIENDRGEKHVFHFASFSNTHQVLTLGVDQGSYLQRAVA